MNLHSLIQYLVWWVPTVLFVLTLLLSFIIGFNRGFRKSLILFINAFISLIICLTIFLIFVNIKETDTFLLNISNTILGNEYALQDFFGVSHSCESFREILIEAIPKNMNYFDGLSLILKDNGQYLSTLVDLSYRLVFGLLVYILYHIFLLIGYIIYLIFFKESKYKKRINKELIYGESMSGYHKRKLGGGFVGLSRGFVRGLFDLSFLGLFFFIIAGGIGDREETNIDLENDTMNYIVDAYDSIGSYGTNGIYKVLNMCKDPNDVPYYLFAADLVFQGKLEDPNRHINQTNIYFRNELSVYTKFSRDTAELLLKYGGSDIRNAILYGTDNVWNILYPLFTNEEFQKEFRVLINEFDMGTYFINLTMSLGVSFASHLSETSFNNALDPMVVELLSILFNPNYHCEIIPYEKNLNSDIKLPILDSSIILTKQDFNILFEIFIDYMNELNNIDTENPNYYAFGISFVRKIIPHLTNLSILKTSNKDKLNPVYKRLYAYCENKFLYGRSDLSIEESISNSSRYYINKEYDNISWVEELNSLLYVCEDLSYLYEDLISQYITTPEEMITSIFGLFSDNVLNKSRLERTISFLETSQILGEVLKTNYITYLIENSLCSVFNNYKLPPNISYSNKYDENGKLIEYGELHNLLSTLEALVYDNSNVDLFLKFAYTSDANDLLISIEELFNKLSNNQYKGKKIIDYAIDSTIFNSILTNAIYSISLPNDNKIYSDEFILIQYSNGSSIIEKNEFKLFAPKLLDVLDIIKNFTNEYNEETFIELLENEKILDLFESTIIRGTVNNVGISYLKEMNDFIVIPEKIENNEIYKLIKIIQNKQYNINIRDVLNGDITAITSLLDKKDDLIFYDLYSSIIISATFTKIINDSIKNYEYNEVINNIEIYDIDSLSYYSYEVLSLIRALKVFDLNITELINGNIDEIISKLKTNLLDLTDSDFVNIWNSHLLSGVISKQLEDILSSKELDLFTDSNRLLLRDTNIFNTDKGLYHFYSEEIYALKTAMVEAFEITDIDNISINPDIFFDILDKNSYGIDKLDVIYDSLIAKYLLKIKLDEVLLSTLKLEECFLNGTDVLDNNPNHLYPIYDKKEIKAFINSIKYGFGIETFDDINFGSIIANIDYNNIEIIYNSYLSKYIISVNLNELLDSEFIDENVRDSSFVKEYDSLNNKVYYYKESELKNIIKANDEIEFFDSNGLVTPNQSVLQTIDKSILYDSYIIRGVITKIVQNNIIKKTDFLVDTILAYDYLYDSLKDTYVVLMKLNEINTLIDIINVENTNDSLSLNTINSFINDSNILWASISKYLIEANDIIIVDEIKMNNISNEYNFIDEENEFVDKDEITYLTSSANVLGINNINDLNSLSEKGNINSNTLNVLFNSLIIRCSIPKIMTLEYSNRNYYLKAFVEDMGKYHLGGNDYYVLKYEEIINTFNILLDIVDNNNGINYSLTNDYTKLFSLDYSTLTSSILILISEYLSDKSITINSYITINFADYINQIIEACNLYNQFFAKQNIFNEEKYNNVKNLLSLL